MTEINDLSSDVAPQAEPDTLRELALSLGLPFEDAVKKGTDYLIRSAIRHINEGSALAPGHVELLKSMAASDLSVADRTKKILEEMYPEPPDE